MRTKAVVLVLVVIIVCGILAIERILSRGFSARDTPGAIETMIARRVRHHAVPSEGRKMKNPVPYTPEVLSEAEAHFADHCASCHGNDGRGQTTIGRNLYPKAPDMRLEATQSLTDGEVFYIIQNGVRLTGMPAWGDGTPEDDLESWKLVHFIRHLGDLSPEALERMKSMNPVSRHELEEEQEIQKFLDGPEAATPPPRDSH